MSETEGDNILNSLKNYSSNFSTLPTRRELLNIDTDTLDVFLQNGGSKNQIKGVRYLSENNEESEDDSNSENLSEMYGGKKNKPSPSDQYHQESINYLKDDLQLSPLEARAYKSLAYRYIKENNSSSTSLEKAKLMLALVKSENFLNEFKDKLDETMKIIESIDSEKEKRLLSEQNNTTNKEEKEENQEKVKKQKKQKGGSKSRYALNTQVIYHRRIGVINDINESPGEETLYTIVFDSGPEVILSESNIIVVNDKGRITSEIQKLTRELDSLTQQPESRPASSSVSGSRPASSSGSSSGSSSSSSSKPASGSSSSSAYNSEPELFPAIKIPNNIDRFEIDTDIGKIFDIQGWVHEYIELNNCPVSPDTPSFVLESFPPIFTPEVNAAFDLVHTPAGGSCLIHAFLLGLSRPYQHLLSDLDRQICGDVFRRHVLGTKYLDRFIQTDQRELMLEPAIVPDSVRADLTDGTVYVYENLEAGTVPGVLSDILKINVLILSPTGFFQLIDKHERSPFIVIYGNGGHYSICLLKGNGTILDRGTALRFSRSIQTKIDAANAARLEANAASANAASASASSANAASANAASANAASASAASASAASASAASSGRASASAASSGREPASAASLGRAPASSVSASAAAPSALAASAAPISSSISPESLAALLGLSPIPLKSSLKYPAGSIRNFVIPENNVFRIDDWMTLFVAENGFAIVDKVEPRLELETSPFNGYSSLINNTFKVLKTISKNNTSLIHAYLFARSKAYINLLEDEDRQTCVNVFIEKILKTIYFDGFKTQNKYTFLNNVLYNNLLLLEDFKAKKINNFNSVEMPTPSIIIYFDGENYKACMFIYKGEKKFLLGSKSLNLF